MNTRSPLIPFMRIAVLLACANAWSADLVWMGGTGDWNAAGNWSPPQVPGVADNAFSDPDNDPLTYSATGIPSGVTFNGSSRTFSGAPTQSGVFAVSVIATDGGIPNLTATTTFNITINPATLTIIAEPKTKA